MAAREVTPGLWASVRSMPPAAWVLFGGSFVNRFGSFVLVFLVIWLTEEGYSPAQAGAAVSAYGVGALGASLLGGYLADRIGRRNAIALSMLSAAATMLALSQADTLGLVLGLSALAGLGFALTARATDVPLLAVTVVIWTIGEIVSAPVSQAYVADLAPPHLRGRYQGAWGLEFGLALILAPVLGTALFAVDPTVLWLTCGALGGIAALLVLGVRPRRAVKPT